MIHQSTVARDSSALCCKSRFYPAERDKVENSHITNIQNLWKKSKKNCKKSKKIWKKSEAIEEEISKISGRNQNYFKKKSEKFQEKI